MAPMPSRILAFPGGPAQPVVGYPTGPVKYPTKQGFWVAATDPEEKTAREGQFYVLEIGVPLMQERERAHEFRSGFWRGFLMASFSALCWIGLAFLIF